MNPEERIVKFDQDGTLRVEHPVYGQMMYCLDRVQVLAAQKPELKKVEPFKKALSGNREAIAKLSLEDLEKIIVATLTGVNTGEFETEARKWLATAKDPRWKRRYTELVYQPMLEVLSYLRATGFKTYIVTGFGQDFVRVYAQQVYGIPPERIIRQLDRRPADAGLYTDAGDGAHLSILVLPDDSRREYDYGPAQGLPDTKVGTFTPALYEDAKVKNWIVISMQNF